jgi:hypothetical protein
LILTSSFCYLHNNFLSFPPQAAQKAQQQERGLKMLHDQLRGLEAVSVGGAPAPPPHGPHASLAPAAPSPSSHSPAAFSFASPTSSYGGGGAGGGQKGGSGPAPSPPLGRTMSLVDPDSLTAFVPMSGGEKRRLRCFPLALATHSALKQFPSESSSPVSPLPHPRPPGIPVWRPTSHANHPRFLSLESNPQRECTFAPAMSARSRAISARRGAPFQDRLKEDAQK